MKINTKTVWQMTDDGMHIIEQESHEHSGSVAECFGGKSSSAQTTTTTQDIDTTSVGLQDIEGIGLGAGRDIEFTQNITDAGAIQGAIGVAESSFDFAGEFGTDAFDFASDVARQAGQTSQQAVETSRQAIATVATGGADELAGINMQTIGIIAAAVAAIFILPKLVKGSA